MQSKNFVFLIFFVFLLATEQHSTRSGRDSECFVQCISSNHPVSVAAKIKSQRKNTVCIGVFQFGF